MSENIFEQISKVLYGTAGLLRKTNKVLISAKKARERQAFHLKQIKMNAHEATKAFELINKILSGRPQTLYKPTIEPRERRIERLLHESTGPMVH